MVFLSPTVDVSILGDTLGIGNVNASTINIGQNGTTINLNGTVLMNGTLGSNNSSGVSGATGWSGVTGVTGVAGINGFTGWTGVTGIGITGVTGPIGATGPAGSGSGSGITLTNNNVSLGIDALYSNINGSNNNAIGFQTLYNNTGSYNSADGYQSLKNNTTGKYNIGLGYNTQIGTTASYSTAIGFNSSTNNFSYSTAIGYQAVNTNASQIMLGSGETLNVPGNATIGTRAYAMYFNSTQDSANYIPATSQLQGGGQIMWNRSAGNGELDIIGYSGSGAGGVNLYSINTNTAAYASQTPQLTFSALTTGCSIPNNLFTSSSANTLTHIGTTSQGQGGTALSNAGGTYAAGYNKLIVSGDDSIGAVPGWNANDLGQVIITGASDSRKRLGFMVDTTNNVACIDSGITNVGSMHLSINGGGGSNVGIGTYYPNFTLDVNGTFYCNNNGKVNGIFYSPATFSFTSSATRAVYVGSDGRLGSKASTRESKESIVPLDSSASEIIYQFQPYSFVYKEDTDKSHLHIGYIAEDIALLDKKVTGYETDASGNETIYSVFYDDIVVYAVAEIKKLKAQIETLTSTVNTLTETINNLNK